MSRPAAGVAGLPERFGRVLDASPIPVGGDDRWVVAVSGGLDSVALLHLLRFSRPAGERRLVVAHFDHGMRPRSGGDAAWVRGLASGWGMTVRVGRAAEPPSSEAGAREARYAFLERVRQEEGSRLVLTAHTADDQAETVLLAVARGSGLRGLAGIPEHREPGVWRPLLTFWRRELEAYAGEVRLGWCEDPTNRDLSFARNAVRRVVLPELERTVAPRARRALVRLAEHAREDEEAWAVVLPHLFEGLGLLEDGGELSLSRDALLATAPALRPRLLRAVVRRAGRRIDRERTRAALDFAAGAESGARLELGGGIELSRDFDRLRIGARRSTRRDRPARIEGPGPGETRALIRGRAYRVAWGPDEPEGLGASAFDPDALSFPLVVRGWRAGDRLRMPYGSKKLKKLFGERRIGVGERRSWPVLVDAHETVLWVPGIARAVEARPESAVEALHVGISRGC